MNLARNLIQGAVGGLLGGTVLGVAEAAWLFFSQGAPDLTAFGYAALLYGAIGLPLGIAAGLLGSAWEKWVKPFDKRADARSLALGLVGAWAPMVGFVLLYVVKKVVFEEKGIGVAGLAGVGGVVLVLTIGMLTAGVGILHKRLSFLLVGPGVLGSWLGLVLVSVAASFVPVGDAVLPGTAHPKAVPAALAAAPNVLVLTIDTLRFDQLGSYGAPNDPTPALDRLGTDGIVFEQAIAHASWTRSSFASLWTSKLPTGHTASTKASRLPESAILLSEVLQEAGVVTGVLANNINVTSSFGFDQGWDTFFYESPDYPFGATESVFALTFYKVVHKLHERYGSGAREVSSFYQPAEVVLDDAQAFITAQRNARWMLAVHLMEPHDPYFEHPYLDGSGSTQFNGVAYGRAEHESPSEAEAAYLARVYADEVRHMDLRIADFLGWLDEQGLYDDLMIVVTADHGEEFGEHGGFWHGTTLYDEQIHVPLLVKLPGGALGGTRHKGQVRLIDVAPTVATQLGVPLASAWEGVDLIEGVTKAEATAVAEKAQLRQAMADAVSAIADLGDQIGALPEEESDDDLQAALHEQREALAMASRLPEPCDLHGAWDDRLAIAEQDFEGNVLSAVRKDGWKLIRANRGNPRGLPEIALFDLISDPGETRNLAGSDGMRCEKPLKMREGSLEDELGRALRESAELGLVKEDTEGLSRSELCQLCALGYKSGPECEGCP